MIGLEKRGLIGDPAVRGGVGLIETVACEGLDEGEDVLGQLGVDAAGGSGARDELLAIDGDLFFLLLPHDFAQLVGLPHGETGDVACDLHDLLLITRDPIRLAEDD